MGLMTCAKLAVQIMRKQPRGTQHVFWLDSGLIVSCTSHRMIKAVTDPDRQLVGVYSCQSVKAEQLFYDLLAHAGVVVLDSGPRTQPASAVLPPVVPSPEHATLRVWRQKARRSAFRAFVRGLIDAT